MGIDPVTHKPKNDSVLTSTDGGQSKNAANLSHMAQWESARLEAEARLVRQSKLISTSSNSFQAQNPEFATTSSSIHKPVGPARCLDVLKAWNGWGKATEAANASVSVAGIGGELGSPTSTLSSSVCDGGTMKEDWKQQLQVPFSTEDLLDTSSFQSTWATESVTGNCSEHVPSGNFVEKFTDLLLNNSSADRRSEDGGESDNGGGSDYYENNKNYWDNILNLVNSSPPDSPIF
ncbi:hypothetical protein RD792_016839 [Penstemon davidsonii]|uniref:Uncharacterized protein n=1 Tax=Penstemon davidsonii TaxID=160366 RepID=A0ABR0CL89_9LAMI|nr:hypothetical protein RD792_016839 [Penstemon davidsonii]